MALSSPNKGKQIFDELRRIWVPATDEELVRQALLHKMVGELGYPRELIAVEKELGQLPHLIGQKIPDRRLDILCFAKDIHPQFSLYPLLLIECKKESLTGAAEQQLLGYNSFVNAYFIGLAGKNAFLFGYPNPQKGTHTFISSLPPYAELIYYLKNGNGRSK